MITLEKIGERGNHITLDNFFRAYPDGKPDPILAILQPTESITNSVKALFKNEK